MGQIFNRIKNIVKSKQVDELVFDDFSNTNLIDDDDELKRAIDEAASNINDSTENVGHTALNINSALKILGLGNSTGITEIKTAYKIKIKEYHPDKVDTLGEEIKSLAKKRTQEINKAYELLLREFGD